MSCSIFVQSKKEKKAHSKEMLKIFIILFESAKKSMWVKEMFDKADYERERERESVCVCVCVTGQGGVWQILFEQYLNVEKWGHSGIRS